MIELMTMGYELLSPEEFFGILKENKVATVVDVRELPLSRRRGFSKTPLTTGLAAQGVKYVHLRALGCPRPIRHAYRKHHDWARYTREYKKYLKTQLPAVKQLWQLVKQEQCCLLCVEKNYNFCHRNFIAQKVLSIADVPMQIHHLTGPIEGRIVSIK